MSCKSLLYVTNTSPVTLTLTAQQPSVTLELGTVRRRFGRNIQLSGNGILLEGEGYYKPDVTVTLTAATAGVYTVQLYQDGVAVPGAMQSVTAAADDVISFSFPSAARLQCCNSSSTLTLALTTTATLPATVTQNNVGVVVEKI